jgi:hypothetical protein
MNTPPRIKRSTRGNPNWGRLLLVPPTAPTAFETKARQLGLTVEKYASSRDLKLWCDRNRNRCYVPEWLLKEWDMTVEIDYPGAA